MNIAEKFKKLIDASPSLKKSLASGDLHGSLYKTVRLYWEKKLGISPLSGEEALNLAWLDPRLPVAPKELPHIYNIFGKGDWTDLFFKNVYPLIKKSDLVVFTPWIKVGGAEKVLKAQIESLACVYENILIILTDTSDEFIEDDFFRSKKITVISHHKDKDLVPEEAALTAFCLTLVEGAEAKKKHVHIANSLFGYKLMQKYGKQLHNDCYLTSNIFCNDRDIYGLPVGYLNLYASIGKFFHNIFTDNDDIKNQLIKHFEIEKSKIEVLSIPTAILNVLPNYFLSRYSAPEKTFIWASRLDRQKSPVDALVAAQALPKAKFRVYGDSVLQGQEYKNSLLNGIDQLSNISYQGSFRSVESINFTDSIFLYTSRWDGLPNIILEVGSIGVPIISYPLPGLKAHFKNNEIIFADEISTDSLIKKISEVIRGDYDLNKYGERIRKKITEFHKVESFHEKFIGKILG